MNEFSILSPCGILGYGFPEDSFWNGVNMRPDAIVVDAGSTDAGPHKLGLSTGIVSKQACKKDLTLMIAAGHRLNVPVIVGSCGGSGAKPHLLWTKEIVDEILREQGLSKKVALIWADIPKDAVSKAMDEGRVDPLGLTVKELTSERLAATNGVVAQMGHEPVIEALAAGAQIILCGRAYDPAPFAAPMIASGFDPALAYHMGKVLECAALCAEPGTTKDCMIGTVRRDGFVVKPTNPARRCTATSVAAHTFYEKDHPYVLHGPGIILNLERCAFRELGDGSVLVTGSRIEASPVYRIKLEGAVRTGYRTLVVAGVRDELLISQIEEIEARVVEQVRSYYKEIDPQSYAVNFLNYGKNAVLGDAEPVRTPGHELGVVFEVLAPTQETANMICATVRSTFLHYGYEGRKSTAGNLAFPFAPSDIPFGPVCEFSVYHLMTVKDGTEMFPVEYYRS